MTQLRSFCYFTKLVHYLFHAFFNLALCHKPDQLELSCKLKVTFHSNFGAFRNRSICCNYATVLGISRKKIDVIYFGWSKNVFCCLVYFVLPLQRDPQWLLCCLLLISL